MEEKKNAHRDFGEKSCRKETTWKTCAKIAG
jgi:hypothetical protein